MLTSDVFYRGMRVVEAYVVFLPYTSLAVNPANRPWVHVHLLNPVHAFKYCLMFRFVGGPYVEVVLTDLRVSDILSTNIV
jgi:hypothetical protein